MTRTITRLLLAPLLLTMAMAIAAYAETGPPAVAVSEETFDFGRVGQNASISHVFWIKNVGGELLTIDDVKPGCGCTKAPLNKNALVPGDSTRVKVTFSTGHYNSSVRKSARIISNAEGRVPSLTIAADVQMDMEALDVFRVDPAIINLDADREGESNQISDVDLVVSNVSNDVLSFSLTSEPDQNVTIDFPQDVMLRPGETQTITVRMGDDMSGRIFAESLTIEASNAENTRVTIPITKSRRWGPAPLSQVDAQ